MSVYVWMAGGRDYVWTSDDDTFADTLHDEVGFHLVLTGGATGLDTAADDWARRRGIDRLIVPANWKQWGKAAGAIRNGQGLWVMQTLARHCAPAPAVDCLVVLFPGGRGTDDCRRKAHKVGLKVVEKTTRGEILEPLHLP